MQSGPEKLKVCGNSEHACVEEQWFSGARQGTEDKRVELNSG